MHMGCIVCLPLSLEYVFPTNLTLNPELVHIRKMGMMSSHSALTVLFSDPRRPTDLNLQVALVIMLTLCMRSIIMHEPRLHVWVPNVKFNKWLRRVATYRATCS
jgi:hypothetical protein